MRYFPDNSIFCGFFHTRMSKMMQAVLQDSPGDETTMYVGSAPVPEAGEGEILIKVCCTALNQMDLLQRKGLYPVPEGASKIIGVEVSGTVAGIGPGCSSKFQVSCSHTTWQLVAL